MKESIISISKPIPKVKEQPSTPEPEQPAVEEKKEQDLPEELPEPLESTIDAQPTVTGFTTTSHSGWKASDILREVRLDNFEIGEEYCSYQE